MAVEVIIKDNTKDVLEALRHNIANGLNAIGLAAEGHAKDNCPVDTGRLRNSITYATSDYSGVDEYGDDEGNQFSGGSAHASPPKNEVHIGSNVEYAAAVEFRDATHKTGKAHYLRDAITKNTKEYKAIMEAALRE